MCACAHSQRKDKTYFLPRFLYIDEPSLSTLTSRYGSQAPADELNALYGDSRAKGFGPEVFIISFVHLK